MMIGSMDRHITIGSMDRRITIQAKSTTMTAMGHAEESWSTVAEPAAAIVPMRGAERFASQQIIGQAVTVFAIRYLDGLTVAHRVVYRGVPYDIQSIREVGRRRLQMLDCVARAD